MNLLLFNPNQVAADGTATASPRQLHHLRQVLGASAGSVFRAGIIGGRQGNATVLHCDENSARLALDLPDAPSPRPSVDLVLALPRPKVARRVLQTAASFGVGHIDLVNAWRVDKSYLDSPAYATDDMHTQLVLGCEQGRTTWLPTVTLHRRLMLFFDGDANRPPATRKLVAHPGTNTDLSQFSHSQDTPRTVIAIGPEGGWIQRELETFVHRDYTPIWLSDRILRVETAITAALAQLELLRR